MQVKAYLCPPEEDDYILLNTTGFDHLPLESQKALGEWLKIYLRAFALQLLTATHFYFASQEKEKEALKAIKEGLGLMQKKLDEVAKRLKK